VSQPACVGHLAQRAERACTRSRAVVPVDGPPQAPSLRSETAASMCTSTWGDCNNRQNAISRFAAIDHAHWVSRPWTTRESGWRLLRCRVGLWHSRRSARPWGRSLRSLPKTSRASPKTGSNGTYRDFSFTLRWRHSWCRRCRRGSPDRQSHPFRSVRDSR
jgi:hypothetical protein